MLKVVDNDAPEAESPRSLLDEIAREGARKMLVAALREEADTYVDQFVGEVDENGHRLVVRNGVGKERSVQTSAGTMNLQAPRVDDRRVDEDGNKATFRSSILPPWCKKSPEVTEVLPLLYLHGMSSGDFAPALSSFFGSESGLSPSVITRLTKTWQDDHHEFMNRDLSATDFVYVWADGVHTRVRLEEDRLCALVLMGVRVDGKKELIAVTDGYRESADSWADLIRNCKRRGMKAPVLAIGDGALGFWRALRDTWPQTKEQRCWFHKTGNVLNDMPKSAHPTAKKLITDIWNAQDKHLADIAINAFKTEFGAKYSKAVAKITNDRDELLAFFDFPAEHWKHLRTTNPIESTFSTVRLRTRVTKGPGSRAAGLAMCFKLMESAQSRWHAVAAPHLVALVRNGAKFEKGVMVEESVAHEEAKVKVPA
jgi:transposase-like protein